MRDATRPREPGPSRPGLEHGARPLRAHPAPPAERLPRSRLALALRWGSLSGLSPGSPCAPAAGVQSLCALSWEGSAPSQWGLHVEYPGLSILLSVQGVVIATIRAQGWSSDRSTRAQGKQDRAPDMATSNWPLPAMKHYLLKVFGLQKPFGSPHVSEKRIYYLFKNTFPILTRSHIRGAAGRLARLFVR